LKQAAIDPSTGKIDISILTTGISGAARKQRAERATLVKDVMREKGKQPTFKYTKLFEEFREKMIEKGEKYPNREMFDEAVQDLEDDGVLIRTGSLIRSCN
jgi:DNA replication licensing factor MCM4